MNRSIKSAHLVFVTLLLVAGISGGARAQEPDAAMTDPVVACVSLADNVLDLRVASQVDDIWSVDANTSIESERGQVTLYVASSQPNLTVSVVFDSLNDKAKLVDGQGKETWLHPANVRTPITVQIPVGVDKTVSLFALEGGGTSQAALVPTKPVGNSNRAVIKQVTTCPK